MITDSKDIRHYEYKGRALSVHLVEGHDQDDIHLGGFVYLFKQMIDDVQWHECMKNTRHNKPCHARLDVEFVVNEKGERGINLYREDKPHPCLKKSSREVKDDKKEKKPQNLACSSYQVYKFGYLHSDISAQNIFVDIIKKRIIDLKEVTDSKKARFLIVCWKNAAMEKTKKFDADKYPLVSCRYLA
uniref:Non-specific serine/threonine protein kinase n=1 Tax=Panagrolaimus sp. ES5 TaxID=591445 RepID=A0AC34FPV4_9BILA